MANVPGTRCDSGSTGDSRGFGSDMSMVRHPQTPLARVGLLHQDRRSIPADSLDGRSWILVPGTETDAPTDFAFAVGDWRVAHRRLRERLVGCTEWIEFDGEMSTRPVLGGFGNIEDNLLHLPEGSYRAIALRSFEPRSQQWA